MSVEKKATDKTENAQELKRLRKITDEMFDLVCVVSLEGRFEWVSRSHETLGYIQDQLLGESALDYVHPDDQEKVARDFSAFLKAGRETAKISYRYLKADGSYLWFETMGKFLYDAAGKQKSILFSSRDVSARIEAERHLRKSEREKRALVESFNEMIFVIDEHLVYREVFSHEKNALYIEKEHIVGKHIGDIGFPEPAVSIIEDALVHVLQTLVPERIEYYFDFPDGRHWYDAQISPMRGIDGQSGGVICVVRDISMRVEVEEALQAEKQRLTHILEATRAGTWEWNVQTGELILNERWAEIIGYRLEELEPVSIETWQRFAHPEDLKKSEEALNGLFAKEVDYYDMRLRMLHRDGHWVWVADRGNVISWNEAGEPLRLSGTHIDVTQEKKTSDALQERTEEMARFFKVNLDLMAIVDSEGRFVRVNREWEHVLGYAPHVLVGQKFMDFVHPDDLAMTESVFEALPNRGEVKGFINRYRCEGGGYRSIEWRSQVHGGLFYAAARDVTRQQEERSALRQMVKTSGYFLGLHSEELDYQKITDEFLSLCDGKAAFFNLYDADGKAFITMALSGNDKVLRRATEMLGFAIKGSSWPHNPLRAEQIKDQITTRFDSLSDLAGDILPRSVVQAIERTFGVGETVIVKIMRKGRMLGDFTLVMGRGKSFDQEEIAEIFSNQLGLAIDRHRAELASEKTRDELERSEEQYRTLVDEIDQGLALYELLFDEENEPVDFKILSVNGAFEVLSGRSREAVVGKRASEVFADSYALWLERFARVALTGESAHYEDHVPQANRYFSIHAYCPKPGYFAVLMEEISERQRLKERLAARDRLLTKLSEQVPGGIYQFRKAPDGTFSFPFASEGIEVVYGLTPDEIMADADAVFARVHPDDILHLYASISESAESMSIWNEEYRILLDNQEIRWIQGSARPEELEDGSILWYGYISDITELKSKQNEIEYLSFHDSLTGLYNRRYMEDAMGRLDHGRQLPLSVIMLDVNGLKLMNDAFGHAEGDALLEAVARILKKSCRADDLIGRVGGDEFLVLLPMTSEAEAESILDRILKVAEEETEGILPVSVAVGLATKTETDQSLEAVQKHADHQMYKDKRKRGRAARKKAVALVVDRLEATIPTERAHLEGVRDHSLKLAKALGLPREETERIGQAARLHDIGKVALPAGLLNKEGPLSAGDRRLVEQHAEIGYQILRSVEHHAQVAEIVWHHHERWDGKGYPLGLKGEKIPLASRILMVADAYEAMTGERSYKEKLSWEEALDELQRCAGTQFDPKLVEVFNRMMKGRKH